MMLRKANAIVEKSPTVGLKTIRESVGQGNDPSAEAFPFSGSVIVSFLIQSYQHINIVLASPSS
jgi:hypothetical protein